MHQARAHDEIAESYGTEEDRAALRSRAIGALAAAFVGDALAEVASELRWVDGDEATGSLMGRGDAAGDADATRESLRAAIQDAGEHAVASGESPLRAAFMLFFTAVYRGHRFDEPWSAATFLAPPDIADVFRAAANSEQREALGVLTLPLVIASVHSGRSPRDIAEAIKPFAFGDPEVEQAFVDYAEAAREAVVLGQVPAVVRQRLVRRAAWAEPAVQYGSVAAPFDDDARGDGDASGDDDARGDGDRAAVRGRDLGGGVLAVSAQVLAEGIAGRGAVRRFTRMPRALGESIAHRVVGSAALPTGMPIVALSLACGMLGTAALPGALVSLVPVPTDNDPLWLAQHAADQILGPLHWPRKRATAAAQSALVRHPDDARVGLVRQAGVEAGLADEFDVVLTLTALPEVRPNKVGGRAMAVPWDLAEGRGSAETAGPTLLDFRDGTGSGPDAGRWRGAQRVADLVMEYRRRGLTVAVDVGDRWETAYAIAVHCRRERERREDWPEMLSPEILVGDLGEPDPGYRERRLLHPLIALFRELEHVHEGCEGFGVDMDDPGDDTHSDTDVM